MAKARKKKRSQGEATPPAPEKAGGEAPPKRRRGWRRVLSKEFPALKKGFGKPARGNNPTVL